LLFVLQYGISVLSTTLHPGCLVGVEGGAPARLVLVLEAGRLAGPREPFLWGSCLGSRLPSLTSFCQSFLSIHLFFSNVCIFESFFATDVPVGQRNISQSRIVGQIAPSTGRAVSRGLGKESQTLLNSSSLVGDQQSRTPSLSRLGND
jgi:hypothetical protein